MKIQHMLAGLLLMFSSGLVLATPTPDSPDDQTISVPGDPTAILPELYAAIQNPSLNQDPVNQNPDSPASPNNHPTFQRAQEANE